MANNLLVSLSTDQLRRIISLKEQIAVLEAQLDQLAGAPVPATPAVKRPGAWKRSTATRAKMAAAQKARWAKLKAPGVKRKLSAATRAKMAAAAKARWAKKRKAKGGK